MKRISCQELLEHFPNKLLEGLEESAKVNWQVKKLKGRTLFKLFLFTLLESERASLRVMEALYHSAQFRIFCGEDIGSIKHSGIAERMAHINPDFFQKIFEFSLQEFSALLEKNQHGQKWNICAFDSTLVSLSSKLLSFGMSGPGKNKADNKQIKYTLGVRNLLPTEVMMFTDQSHLSEEVALKEVMLNAIPTGENIFVFDRGLQSRTTFAELNGKDTLFVTRLKGRVRYREVEVHRVVRGRKSETLELQKDIIVRLKDRTEKFMNTKFRMIVATSRITGEELIFLTNIMSLNAREITDIYRQRWQIEVFFRFLKQELNFKHLISRTRNGIAVMLYMTMIVAILLLVYKTRNRISGYKTTKLHFLLDLEMEIIKDIVLACNGDISRFLALKNPHPS